MGMSIEWIFVGIYISPREEAATLSPSLLFRSTADMPTYLCTTSFSALKKSLSTWL